MATCHIVRTELRFRQTVEVVGHRWLGIFPGHPTLTPGKTDRVSIYLDTTTYLDLSHDAIFPLRSSVSGGQIMAQLSFLE